MVQLQFLDLMIPEECGAMPMDAATRADLIDLMARVLVVVFHEEGGSLNDRSIMKYYTVPRSNRSTWLARRSSTFGSPAKARAQDGLGSAVAGAAASPAALQPDGAPEMSGVRVQPTFSLASSRFLTRLRDNA